MNDLSNFFGPAVDWLAISPLLSLLAGALTLLLVGSLTGQWPWRLYAHLTALSAVIAIAISIRLWGDVGTNGARLLIGGALALDQFALFAAIAICLAIALVSYLTSDYLNREGVDLPEIYALYLTAGIGALVMIASNDLVVLFLGLETLGLSLYLLAASNRRQVSSQEAGLKYFILGGFASAFFLYGVALVYGVTGSTRLINLNAALTSYIPVPRNDAVLLIGIGMILIGFAFKVSLVPFQAWTPDVYQGAPTPTTAFVASVGKIAALVALVRVFVVAFPSRSDDWGTIVFVLSALTLVVGSVVAVVQTNVKRMLAYSSISHAGFILVGLEAASHRASANVDDGLVGVAVYVVLYAAMVVGTFGVVTVVTSDQANSDASGSASLDSFKGLAKSQPLLGLAMTVLLLAQAGMPLTSGFVAKFGVIQAAVAVGSYELAVIAMVCAVIAAFVYLRIMVSMWLADPSDSTTVKVPPLSRISIAVAVAVTLVTGFLPSLILDLGSNLAELASK
ncbi:MAG: NADH-quinone oxidoreductase subunit N [Actinobacteria bacterium]|nr:NADH-quinone oxidoreductase subunit N [Actinomycetota bacterium]